MKIIFIRHAESIKNVEKRHGKAASIFGLTSKGVAETEILARKILFKGSIIDKIYASDSNQATETSKIFSNILSVNTIVLENFQSLDYGIVCGMSTDEIKKEYPEIQAQVDFFNLNKLHPKDFNIPSMETALDFEKRINNALSFIFDNSNNDSTVAVITHTSIINFAINIFNHFPLSITNGDFKRYNLPNLSFTIVKIDINTRILVDIEINKNHEAVS